MSKELSKKQAELERLLARKIELDSELSRVWQELRMERIAAIRGDDDPGELPAFLGLDELQRSGQARAEQLARENHAIDTSPEHQAGLRDLNAA